MASFAHSIIKSRAGQVYFFRGTDATGRMAWYYVMVKKALQTRFEALSAGDPYNLLEFGEILASGYSAQPSDEVVQRMYDEYGYEPAESYSIFYN